MAYLAGCATEPPGSVWRIELAGHTVGQERRTDSESGWVSQRSYSMLMGDDVVAFEAASTWTVVNDAVVAWQSGDDTVSLSEPLPRNLFARQTPGPGRVFDPSTRAVREGRFDVVGDVHSFSDADVHWWVEHSGSEVAAYGADSVRVSRESGPLDEWPAVDPAVVLGLRGTGPLPSQGQLYARVRVRGGAVPLLDTQDGELEIHRPLWEEIPNSALTAGEPATTPVAAEIVAELAGLGLRDAVAGLVLEVPRRLRYSPTPVTDPRAALHGARGDCTEHVALFVEVATALGVPARPVVGWIAQPDGNWVPHAWASITVPGPSQVPVDPTLGQRIASPARLPLAVPFQARPWEVLGRAAGSRVEVVEIR